MSDAFIEIDLTGFLELIESRVGEINHITPNGMLHDLLSDGGSIRYPHAYYCCFEIGDLAVGGFKDFSVDREIDWWCNKPEGELSPNENAILLNCKSSIKEKFLDQDIKLNGELSYPALEQLKGSDRKQRDQALAEYLKKLRAGCR